MAVDKLELETYFGKCKCCPTYGYLRTMWEKHAVESTCQHEIYGQMLTECFCIEWTIQNSEEDDLICEDCIWKLREAFTFKNQVLQCQKEVVNMQVNKELEIKSDADKGYDIEYLEEEYLEEDNNNEDSYQENGEEREDGEERENENEKPSSSFVYEEDNEEDDTDENENTEDEDEEDASPDGPTPRKRKPRPRQSSTDDDDSDTDAPKPKWPKKLPKQERWKTYRQYSDKAMVEAVQAVVTKTMSQKDASEKFKVPRKTLSAKVVSYKNNEPLFPTPSSNLVNELKTLLSFVDATPFRSWGNQYCCFYCPERYTFPHVDALKQHTQTHNYETELKQAMLPVFNNETVKLDLTQVHCTVCSTPLHNWKNTVKHLRKKHSANFRDCNKMIPFELNEAKCVICDKDFASFMKLDYHMNSHFKNYVCGHCGAPFASTIRLNAHEKTHDTGRYRCNYPPCNKVFNLEKYLKRHVSLVHKGELKVKCRYCNEKFKGESQRHAHIVECHNEYVDNITCELCGMAFNWSKTFMDHMKRKHNFRCACRKCGKCFKNDILLKEHEAKHTGVMKYKCLFCSKFYYSKSSLERHLKYMHLDSSFTIIETG